MPTGRWKETGTKIEEDKGNVGRSGTQDAQVRILFSHVLGGERRGETIPRWVKYSGPVPSKGAGLSPP